MKYQVHVTYMNGAWNLFDYTNTAQLQAAVADWVERTGHDVKVFAVYTVK